MTNTSTDTGTSTARGQSPRPSPTPSLDLGPSSAPGKRLLKRAGNLFTAQGEPAAPAIYVLASGSSSSTVKGKVQRGLGSSSEGSSSSNLGASLRRTLSEVKNSGRALKRSISVGRKTNEHRYRASATATRHGRSFSENLGSRPPHGLTVQQMHRKSATFATQSLSPGISEVSSMDAVGEGTGADVKVPLLLQQGTPMTKVSAKKKKTVMFRIDPDEGYVLWESKKSGIIPIEYIKEIRSGADARYYREQFQLSAEYESRWLTLVYIVDGRYKTLHAVATTPDVFTLWDRTLRALFAVRQELMSGLGHLEARQSVWERRYWRGADSQRDDKLTFDEVERMCKRLNLNFSKEDLERRFAEADTQLRGYLDFDDFRRFVRLLKDRPDITRLYKKLANNGAFNFTVFESFMHVFQKSKLSSEELEAMFRKHAGAPQSAKCLSTSEFPPTPPPSAPLVTPSLSTPGHQPSQATPNASDSIPSAEGTPSSQTPSRTSTDASSTPASDATIDTKPEEKQCDISELTMSLETFTSFLLSTDNSPFTDQAGKIWQDMTRPLSEYFISSSHNTYLVGHQLVGVSTIEGYIRALLHSCRSVEIDIYDGETEPVIYHGKTLTSKVPLRDICNAISKYAFVASPYPVIISAEVHCSLVQQDRVASIMRSVFGDALVCAPPGGRPLIEKLPSPEDLRGRVLLKAKNLYVTEKEGIQERKVTVNSESSETSDTSASEPEFGHDIKVELKHELSKARNADAVKEIREEFQKVRKAEPMKEIKEEFHKARNLYDRVRRKKSPSPAPAKREGLSSPPTSPPTQSSSLAPSSPRTVPTEHPERPKVKMSFELVALLVYTVGVKCRGFNKKETYAPEHVFSLSEKTANKVIKQSMFDLIKHNRTHIVRIYPKGTRLNSSNYAPHKYWAAGAQLVAINWQTFDLGYMINHSMFQRNGRAGYVLKPPALRNPSKELLNKRTNHFIDLKIISAQQLPRRKDSEGREIINGSVVDPYVEASVHIPDWSQSPLQHEPAFTSEPTPSSSSRTIPVSLPSSNSSSSSNQGLGGAPSTRTTTVRTGVVKNNGFNPVWEESLSLPFDCVGDILDLVFLRIAVRADRDDASDEPLAVYCVSLGSLQQGYKHLPLHDPQLSQYLFSTLFVHINIRNA